MCVCVCVCVCVTRRKQCVVCEQVVMCVCDVTHAA